LNLPECTDVKIDLTRLRQHDQLNGAGIGWHAACVGLALKLKVLGGVALSIVFDTMLHEEWCVLFLKIITEYGSAKVDRGSQRRCKCLPYMIDSGSTLICPSVAFPGILSSNDSCKGSNRIA